MSLSIIVPCLNEGDGIEATLAALSPLRRRGTEVIVVDGGSTDATVHRAREADRIFTAPRGRSVQMNAGAARASGGILLFLHADCRLPLEADRLVIESLQRTRRGWGRFDVHIESRSPLLRLVAALMNLRSRMTGIATGDQALFVTRPLFEAVGGFPAIGLMEDIALSRRLKRYGRPLCLKHKVAVSARRWERHGILATIVLMWRLRFAYWLGADPDELAMRYAPHKP
ncbi:MAG TPA: TIGR04283 family arsenosugar biosynthesis glycosyltransferase [Burkholderiales bacterium]|nr:TIGR04283 family arsenosugar biosynthesis glycosyltransferase [Burkholderiales bacterium]